MPRTLLTLAITLAILVGCRNRADNLIGPDPIEQVFASPEYGLHTAMWWNVTNGGIPDIDMVKNAGFGWVKQKFAWRDVENIKKGEYDVYRIDRIVEEVNKADLKLLVRIDRQPQWTQEDPTVWIENAPPTNYQDFGDFCGWLADRHRGQIHAYQVWNEPNLHREWGWQPPDPQAYTDLLAACYTAIKAADPDAIVISAGLAPTGSADPAQVLSDEEFLHGMYEAGANRYFDVLGLHAPGYKAPPELDPEVAATQIEDNGLSTYGGHRFFSFRHVEDMAPHHARIWRRRNPDRHPRNGLDNGQSPRFTVRLASCR